MLPNWLEEPDQSVIYMLPGIKDHAAIISGLRPSRSHLEMPYSYQIWHSGGHLLFDLKKKQQTKT